MAGANRRITAGRSAEALDFFLSPRLCETVAETEKWRLCGSLCALCLFNQPT